ncbi:MAG: ComF family protein [Candidatus Thiodiazotropha sp. (ex Myrtea sp. 'scaly one' KF741663)]|nr:ComF family protein [Candidatus Thiodiazotropha sp. (ex Myrtea sp. 'scaly one' KF741663)]
MPVYNCLNFIRSLVLPERCPCCGIATGSQQFFCNSCYSTLPFNNHACPQCALPLPPQAPPQTLCGRCIQRPPIFHRGVTALRYEAPINHLISGLKFNKQLHLAEPLAKLMIDRLGDIEDPPDTLIPVPLHPLRLRERGFNQSLELARLLAKYQALDLNWRAVRRIRSTTAQTGLSEKARRKNLRSAFEVNDDLAGRHVALFDDVITTGATITELSRTLLRAGVKRIDIWALARTPIL